MPLHEQLRTLVSTHGPSILDTAEGFRGALDDFLTEDEATAGELNLLVDAVRLGSVRRLVSLLDQGADPSAALAEAAAQLARDRDTAPDRARWALAMLGYALRRLDATIPVVADEAPPPAPHPTPPVAAPPEPPPPPPPTVPATSPAYSSGASTTSTTGGRARRAGLVLVALLLVVGGVVTALIWPDGDDDTGLRSGGRTAATEDAGDDSDAESGDEGSQGGRGGTDGADCAAPVVAPIDVGADASARCLAGEFDLWAEQGLMAVGQQVNLDDDQWMQPLEALAPNRVRILGFDFKELANAADAGKDRVPDLIELAQDGYVLTATWHADNPWTGGDSWDLTDNDRIGDLLAAEGGTRANRRFWRDWDEALAAIEQLRDSGVPIILRPLHEANGPWFWWGHHDPAVFTDLWAAMRGRVDDAGLHNVLWHYSAAPKTWEGIQNPLEILPQVDFAGLDTYDCEQPGNRAEYDECGGRADYSPDLVELASYAELAERVPRMSLSEVGPQFSFDGSWDPGIVTTRVTELGFRPAYALFWFDDRRTGRPPMAKQLSSLKGAEAWLAACPEALCDVS